MDHTEIMSFSTTYTKTNFICSYTGIKSSSISHTAIKSIWTTDKIQKNCMLALKTSDIRPVYKNQVDFDHPHKNQIHFIPTLKSS